MAITKATSLSACLKKVGGDTLGAPSYKIVVHHEYISGYFSDPDCAGVFKLH